jgi:hypothetical protein
MDIKLKQIYKIYLTEIIFFCFDEEVMGTYINLHFNGDLD